MNIIENIMEHIIGININNINNNIDFTLESIIHLLGFSAPGIMLVTSAIILRNRATTLKYFIIGYILNGIFNGILKVALKEPRPSNDWQILQIGITHNKRIGFDKYGMPSGHAQHCGYILAFMTLAVNDPFVTGVYSILSLICLYQRYLYQNHTIIQVVIGFIVGIGFGYLIYQVSSKKLIGNIKLRPDDNAPF
jgi:membrane-associated phospholipid phosphatase